MEFVGVPMLPFVHIYLYSYLMITPTWLICFVIHESDTALADSVDPGVYHNSTN